MNNRPTSDNRVKDARELSRRHGRCDGQDERGAILILALVYIIVIGVVVAALTTWASGDLNNTGNFNDARNMDYSLSSAMEVAINNIRYTAVVGSNNATPPVACWGSAAYAATSTPTYTTYSTYVLPTSPTNNIAVWCSTRSVPLSAVTRTVTLSACSAPSTSTIATAWATATEIQAAATACDNSPDLQALVSFDDYNGSKTVLGYGAALQDWEWSSSVQSTVLPNSISVTSSIPEFPVANTYYNVVAAASSGDALTITTSPSSSCSVSGKQVEFLTNGTTCNIYFNDPGDANYAPAQYEQSIQVGPVANTISVSSAIPTGVNAEFGQQYTPVDSATSGDSVAITVDASSSPTNACSVNGSGIVTFNYVGTCVLDFNDPGNADYLAATQQQQTIPLTAGPPAGMSILANPTSPTNGIPNNGDSLTYLYNETMNPSSIYSGFSGLGSASVCVDLTTVGGSSSYQTIWTVYKYSGSGACNTNTLVNLGSVNLGDGASGKNYIAHGVTAAFTGTMTMTPVSGDSQVVVTLGNESGNTTVSAVTPTTTLTWTPNASATGLANTSNCSTASVTEANAPKANF
jgi:hypothetical protein